MPPKDECEYGKANRMLIEKFEATVADIKKDMKTEFDKVWQKLDQLTQLLNGRPSWSVTAVITILSSLCVGLTTFIICNAHKLLGK